MKNSLIKTAVLSAVLALTACSHLTDESGTSSTSAQSVLNQSFAQLEQAAANQNSFQYQLNKEMYKAYFNGGSLSYVLQQGEKGERKVFYKAGKLYGVQDAEGSYEFDAAGKLITALNSSGNTLSLSAEALAKKQQELNASGKKLAAMLSSNSADRSVGSIRTGGDAKLNYLCIAKIQQVASTKRVFRSSPNKAGSTSRLTADVRLNGNQYYNMDCQLQGERVALLSLIQK
ncbi:hypothetical protein [Testudinibacter aquarius]|uniref:Lipoprotein n=1 Tax=Testudinibacter aquarius TaxID=1524974 RepID=A0A4V6P403_9PAST|nr:hypothetical protein [Testudinibacter aquarius]KAE9527454.1 hypothetical protein A1D24_02105 [Testudinibacter aquarius]TCV89979.1 hypothetical protein EDC16_101292 [Testudinibacter aquarius]TNG93009.1 hypothetical protein FHQ21_02705 [Testudinibacter aquarius]